eukprot:6180466-Amphidinium_carterae.1
MQWFDELGGNSTSPQTNGIGPFGVVTTWASAVAVHTGHVKPMLKLLPAWTDTSQCALATRKLLSPGVVSPALLGLASPGGSQWLARIKDAKNPGPLVCTCNPGGWSRAEGLLSMGYDL